MRYLEAVEAEWSDGRFSPVEGTEVRLECDLLHLALGFVVVAAPSLASELGVALTDRGDVAVDEAFRTNVDGVYAAGDAMRGASLVVWAISDGREAARVIDADLSGGRSRLPTRGDDRPF